MPYATYNDVKTIYQESVLARLLYNEDLAEPGIDTAQMDRALVEATAEIDTHLSARYPVPLPAPPPIVRRLCVDIAVYLVALPAEKMTEEITTRYKAAVKLLERIAEGKAGLGLASDPETGEPGMGSQTGAAESYDVERA